MDKYKAVYKLFCDKKSVITDEVVKELNEFNRFKFQLILIIEFFQNDGATERTRWCDRSIGHLNLCQNRRVLQ